MNLHAIVSGAIGVVNPHIPVALQINSGWTVAAGSGGARVPAYQTPGAMTASIAAGVMTVTAVTAGVLAAGQTVLGAGVAAGTEILEVLSGNGGIGTYKIFPEQAVASEAMTTALTVMAQVQALTFRDLQQIDGLNLQGTRRAIYLYGKVQGINRAENKGGDLITVAAGDAAGKWLVAEVLEQWPDWVKVACTQQQP